MQDHVICGAPQATEYQTLIIDIKPYQHAARFPTSRNCELYAGKNRLLRASGKEASLSSEDQTAFLSGVEDWRVDPSAGQVSFHK